MRRSTMQRIASSMGVETSTLQAGRSGSRLTESARRLWASVVAMGGTSHSALCNTSMRASAARRDEPEKSARVSAVRTLHLES
jgi:hypothetical protein